MAQKTRNSILKSVAMVAAFSCTTLAATAQEAPEAIGKVLSIVGPDASAIVLRGPEAFELSQGDFLFLGDKVFTRSQGVARLEIDDCDVEVPAASFIEVDDEACNAGALGLEASNGLNAVALGIGAAEGVGAAAPIGPLLATGATGAAAAGVAAAQGTSEAPSAVD